MVGDAAKHVAQIGFGIEVVELAGLDQRSDDRPVFRAVVVAGEERILAGERDRPFILPMSGRSWKSITAGIPILGARS